MNAGPLPSGHTSAGRHLIACQVLSWTLYAGTTAIAAESPPSKSPAPSPAVAAAVTAALPKYAPASEEPSPEPRTSPAPVDALAPTDELVKLPTVTVRRRPNDTAPADAWLSQKGRDDLAFKQNPGLRIGNLFRMNQGVASEMRREEQAAKKRDALKDEVERVSVGTSKADRKLRRLMKDAVARPNTEWLNGR